MRRMIQSVTACLLVLASLTMTGGGVPLGLGVAQPEAVLADDATITTCTEPAFNAALAAIQGSGGGTLVITCSDPITFSSQKTITSDVTIVGDGAILDGEENTRLFEVNSGARLVLIGLTLQNGNAQFGGAIDNDGTLEITASTFSGNRTDNSGGAIYNNGGTLAIAASTFSGNSASQGGAIYNFGGTLEITASTFSGNRAESNGGAIYNNGTLAVTASTFSGNRAFQGGAIWDNGTLEITASTFNGNRTDNSGGAIYNNGTLAVTASTFSGNRAESNGGAIYNNGGMLTVTASTFSGNRVESNGGAIYNHFGTLTIGASILANSPSGGNCSNLGTVTSEGYNLSDDTSCGLGDATDQQGGDVTINLGDLADNGGLTETMLPQPGSDAIEAIPEENCLDISTSPGQRGVPRLQDACEIGAVELGQVPVQIITTYNLGPIDEGDTVAIIIIAYGPADTLLTYQLDCDNNGTFEISQQDEPSAGCTFSEAGSHPVPVQVSDGTTSATDQTIVEVLALVPTIDDLTIEPSPSNEGDAVTLTASFTNPDPSAMHGCTIDWGNDTVEDGAVEEQDGSGSCEGSHTYADDDYDITITVCDDEDCDEVSTTHTVNNLPPTVDTPVLAPSPSAEGASVELSATFSDPGTADTHICEIDWGDGTVEARMVNETNGSGSCAGSHSYADNGEYMVTVEVCDDDGDCDDAASDQTVTNVAPSVTTPQVDPSPSDEGQSVVASATFSDPGGAPSGPDSHTCTVDYGDGSGPQDGTVENGACTGPAHTYADDGDYTITVEVCDSDSDSDCGQASTIHPVTNLPPVIEEISTESGELGEPVTVTVSASDPGLNDVLMYSFDCAGDGIYDIGPQPENTADCPLDPAAASTTIKVLVEDGDGGSDTGSVVVSQALTLCGSAYTGGLSGSTAGGGCPAGTTTLTLPATSSTMICIDPYTGALTWAPRGSCGSGHQPHLVPDDGPLAYCQSTFSGKLRFTQNGQCTTYEQAGVIPG